MEKNMINIELAKDGELNEINKIAKQVHDLHVKWRPDIFYEVEEVISKEMFNQLIENNQIYVVKEEKNIIGYAIINIKERKNIPGLYDRKILDLEAIAIDSKFRNKGIGTEFIKYIVNIGKKQGCTDLYLSVNEENINAKRCYEKIGMKVKNIKYSMKI